MKLESNGIRVEMKGKVRISYSLPGHGHRFRGNIGRERRPSETATCQPLASRVIMRPGAPSPHPTTGPMEALPAITHPEAAMRALIEFFEITSS
jgi:hypothetical protein